MKWVRYCTTEEARWTVVLYACFFIIISSLVNLKSHYSCYLQIYNISDINLLSMNTTPILRPWIKLNKPEFMGAQPRYHVNFPIFYFPLFSQSRESASSRRIFVLWFAFWVVIVKADNRYRSRGPKLSPCFYSNRDRKHLIKWNPRPN